MGDEGSVAGTAPLMGTKYFNRAGILKAYK